MKTIKDRFSLPKSVTSHEIIDNSDNSTIAVRLESQTTSVFIDMKQLNLEVPKALIGDEDAMKEWLWQNSKDKLIGALTVKHEHEPTELQKAQLSLNLLDGIATVQRQYLQMEEPRVVFGALLDKLLELMDSEYGFIGEVKHQEDGTPYLQTHAITNIAWDAATNAFYEENVESGLKFLNMNSLFGHVIMTTTPIIANEPKKHSSACGIPEGHPPLNHFLGIPFFEARGMKMNGMVGIANKPGGYTQEDIDFLEPFVCTCSNLIQAYNAIRQNKYLINTLEEKVMDRTKELHLTNKSLKEANRRVVRASQAQLQHFACMSHEIRTPLNCIIGLSSLLQETTLNPYQQDSLKMIVTSGDLLLTVVNDVLDYSKLESGNVDIDIRRSNLQEVLDAVVHSIAQKSKSRNLSVNTFYDNTVPEFVHTDNRRLQQILYNLLGNAIKFSHEGGSVELHVKLIEDENWTDPALEEVHEDDEEDEEEEEICESDATSEDPSDDEAQDTEEPDETAPETESGGGPSQCPFTGAESSMLLATKSNNGASKCPFSTNTPEKDPIDASERSTASERSSFTAHDLVDARASGSSFSSEVDSTVTLFQNQNQPSCRRIIRFVVKDYGAGINKKHFVRIFKPFKQANSHTEQTYGGTGLGLAITSQLVRGLGGNISVDSVEGEWSEFTVDFPFPHEPADIGKITKSLSNVTILTVHSDSKKMRVEKDIFDKYKIDHRRFHCMGEMNTFLSKPSAVDTDRFYINLVQEDLYRAESYKLLSSMAKSALLTFGPNYSVKDTNGHYRSLVQVLPSVLIQSFYEKKISIATSRGVKRSDSFEEPVAYDEIKVLIAEDNLINQKVLTRMLNRLGINKVDIANNGQQAVDQEAVHKNYDIVFMDMQMPIMGGIDACKLIVKRRGGHALPKVVFVTANVSNGFESEAANAGGDGFISKPFNIRGIAESFKLLGKKVRTT
jgi:signal transduction histidine kinase/CheY-like chemotaxis protein